jgi:peroxiredoxin
MRWLTWTWPGVLALACAAATAVESGQPAPAFSAPALPAGGDVSLADYAGQVVYLDFWASWCAPCRQSLPWMEEQRREFADRGFEVIAINVDENPRDALKFLERVPVSYPVVADHRGQLANLYNVSEMPSSFLIDRQGVVRLVHRGFNKSDAARLRQQIATLVGED